MGILDNVRGRLGLGGQRGGYRDDGDYGYDDEGGYGDNAYDEDYDDGAYADDPAGDGGGFEPAAMRGFGVDRADYYSDSNVPLVSRSDVRSQPPAARPYATARTMATAQQRPDRIAAPRVSQRATNTYKAAGFDEDMLAFKDGLARGEVHSLTQLQDERLRLEDTGRFAAVGAGAGSVGSVGGIGGAGSVASAGSVGAGFVGGTGLNGGAGSGTGSGSGAGSALPRTSVRLERGGEAGGGTRIVSGHVRPRGNRRIEYLTLVGYAEAEQITRVLKGGSVVVLDLTQARPELAKRILDFSFGVASALDGQVDRYADRVYVFTTRTALTDEERASIRLGR